MNNQGDIRRFDSDEEAERQGYFRKLKQIEAEYLETIPKEKRVETHQALRGMSSQFGKNYFQKIQDKQNQMDKVLEKFEGCTNK